MKKLWLPDQIFICLFFIFCLDGKVKIMFTKFSSLPQFYLNIVKVLCNWAINYLWKHCGVVVRALDS